MLHQCFHKITRFVIYYSLSQGSYTWGSREITINTVNSLPCTERYHIIEPFVLPKQLTKDYVLLICVQAKHHEEAL